MKTIYLIRHSSPFVSIDNYKDYENKILWDEYNRNMILSVVGEKMSEKLCSIEELQQIEEIYCSNSARAIATAKYLAEANNLLIKFDDRINEREFGVNYISELPHDFTKTSFEDKNYKLQNGESLNELDSRFCAFLENLLSNNKNNIAVVIHGIILLSYLQTLTNFKYDGKIFKISFNGKVVVDGNLKSPGVYKIEFDDDKKVVDISDISFY